MQTLDASRRAPVGMEVANIIIGIWVAISPFVLGFSRNVPVTWSNVAVGIGVVLVALAGQLADEGLRILAVVLGAWLFLSSFVLGFSTVACVANNVSMAFIVITAAAMSEGLLIPGKTR